MRILSVCRGLVVLFALGALSVSVQAALTHDQKKLLKETPLKGDSPAFESTLNKEFFKAVDATPVAPPPDLRGADVGSLITTQDIRTMIHHEGTRVAQPMSDLSLKQLAQEKLAQEKAASRSQ